MVRETSLTLEDDPGERQIDTMDRMAARRMKGRAVITEAEIMMYIGEMIRHSCMILMVISVAITIERCSPVVGIIIAVMVFVQRTAIDPVKIETAQENSMIHTKMMSTIFGSTENWNARRWAVAKGRKS